ncbi:MAG: hypothetical protein HOO96_14355 [Polyangiaceae bacterium]|nr:hypothetical protein [Polyangiaceae bacterium]
MNLFRRSGGASLSLVPVLGLFVLTAACGGAASAEDEPAEGADDLTASTITSFTVRQSTGFSPPSPTCRPSGAWTLDLAQKKMTGTGCVDGRTVTVDRALGTAEVKDVRTALSKVRTAARPAACPTDVPVLSLDVSRGSRAYYYVQQRSACGGGTPVTTASIAALLDTVVALVPSAAAFPTPVGASTCDGVPCFAVKGSCWDTTTTGATQESFANVTFTYVPAATFGSLTWRRDQTLGTSRATQRLLAWLQNSQTVFVDGTRHGTTLSWESPPVNVFVKATQTEHALELVMDTNGGSSCRLSAELR